MECATLADALREHLPKTAAFLEKIAAALRHEEISTSTFARLYPKCENISVDYAVLEPRSAKGEQAVEHLLPARRFWLERSGIVDGAPRAHMREEQRQTEPDFRASACFTAECERELCSRAGKFVAAVGVMTWWWWKPKTRC